MGTGDANSELMSLQVSFNDGLHIDVDDAIGGATAFDPGHCLSLLTEPERTAYLLAECSPEENCNVSVEATAATDGKNNEWRIETDGPVTALICQIGNPGDQFVIGQTTLTFGFDAVKK